MTGLSVLLSTALDGPQHVDVLSRISLTQLKNVAKLELTQNGNWEYPVILPLTHLQQLKHAWFCGKGGPPVEVGEMEVRLSSCVLTTLAGA